MLLIPLMKCISYILALGVCSAAAVAAEAPVLSLDAPKQAVEAGKPVLLEVRTSWTGAVDAYTVLPVELPEAEWATLKVMSMAAAADGERAAVTQLVELIPSKEGEHELASMSVAVLSGTDPAAPPAYTLQTEPVKLSVRAAGYGGNWRMAVLLGAVAGGVAGLSLYLLSRRRRSVSAPVEGLGREEAMRAALSQARRHQLDGLYYEFYRDLARAASFAKDGEALAAKLEQRAQEVGFKGVRPSPDDLNADLRDVERVVTRAGNKEAMEVERV